MPTVTVLITADVDDGYERVGTATWFNASMSNDIFGFLSGLAYNLGDRFASGFTVPQGAVISSATLTLDATSTAAGTATGTVYGVKQGNASAFSNGNLPSGVPKTTASTAVSWSGLGTQTADVTAIIQEIVNQGNYFGGNAVALVVITSSSSGSNYIEPEDFFGSAVNCAQLSVTYTAPAAYPIQATSQAASAPAGNMTLSFGSNTTAGTFLVASVSVKGLNSGITVSDNVNGSWTEPEDSTSTNYLAFYYFANGAGGALTITLGGVTGAAAASISISEWHGVITVSPFDAGNAGNNGAGSAMNNGSNVPATSSQTKDLYICALQLATNSTGLLFASPPSASSSTAIQLYSQTNLLDGIQDLEWFINSTASNVLPAWSWTTGQPYQTYTVAFKTTSGGATVPPPFISIPDVILRDTSDSYRAEGYASIGTGMSGLASVWRGAGAGGRQPVPIHGPVSLLGDVSAGEHYGFSQVLGAPPSHFVAVNQLLSEPDYALGDSTYFDGSSQLMQGFPIYHHKFGSVAPVVAIGHQDYAESFTETLRAQPFRQIVPPPPPNATRPPPAVQMVDQTYYDGTGQIIAPGALKPGLARPKIIATQIVLGDTTNAEGASNVVHGVPPKSATGPHSMVVLVGDQTSYDGAISIAVHGASYRQPVQAFEPVFVLGDQTNQDGMVESPIVGARKLLQILQPIKIVLGDQTYADGSSLEMGPWEDQNKHLPAEPIVALGHQEYSDGLAIKLGAQPYFTHDPIPAILADFGEQPTSIGMSDGQAFLPLHGRVWHVVAPVVPNYVMGDQTLQEAILGNVVDAQPTHRNILAPTVFVSGDQTNFDGMVEVPLQGRPHTQPFPNPTINSVIGDQSFIDGLPLLVDYGAPLHQVQVQPLLSIGDQTDVPGASHVLLSRHTQHIFVQEPLVAIGDSLGQEPFNGQSLVAFHSEMSQRPPFIPIQSVLADQTNIDGISQLFMGAVYARASVRSVLEPFYDQDVVVPLSDHNYTQVLYAQPSRGSVIPPQVGLPDAVWLTTKRDTVFKFDPTVLWWQINVMRQ